MTLRLAQLRLSALLCAKIGEVLKMSGAVGFAILRNRRLNSLGQVALDAPWLMIGEVLKQSGSVRFAVRLNRAP